MAVAAVAGAVVAVAGAVAAVAAVAAQTVASFMNPFKETNEKLPYIYIYRERERAFCLF